MWRFFYINYFLIIIQTISNAQLIHDNNNHSNTFYENKGQLNQKIYYQVELKSGLMQLCNDRIRYEFRNQRDQARLLHNHHPNNNPIDQSINYHRFDVHFLNARIPDTVFGENPLSHSTNYFVGPQEFWATNVKQYDKVTYKNLYDGIDFSMYSKNGFFKYEFIVAPHKKTKKLSLKFDGVKDVKLREGHLIIRTSVNGITEKPPFAYQIIHGEKRQIECSFQLENNILSYKLGKYNKNFPLIIDPQLIFSTYSGSTADNWGNTACLDKKGNLYTGGTVFRYRAGTSQSTGIGEFPNTTGAFQTTFQGGDTDIGILKFDSSGTNLLYATHIGGTGAEIPTSTITNEKGELFILGITSSTDFPTSQNAYQKEFTGALSSVEWYVNGQKKDSSNIKLFDLNSGDSIFAVVNYQFGCFKGETDTSKFFIVDLDQKLNANLQLSDSIFCPNQSINIQASVSNWDQKFLSYKWFINGVPLGIDTNRILIDTPTDQDLVKCIVSATSGCEKLPIADTLSTTLVSAENKSIDAFLKYTPEIDSLCLGDIINFSIGGIYTGVNPNVSWIVNQDTISNSQTLSRVLSSSDTISAFVTSSFSCLLNTNSQTDTILISPDTLLSLQNELDLNISYAYSRFTRCPREVNISVDAKYPRAIDNGYQLFINDVLLRESSNGVFSRVSFENGDVVKIRLTSARQCIDTSLVIDTLDPSANRDFEIITSTDSLCILDESLLINYTNLTGFSNSLVPVGGYTFEGGTDIVVVKLSKNGDSLLASSYLGGTAMDGISYFGDPLTYNYGDQLRGDINVDDDDNIYISSTTSSYDYPVKNAFQPEFGGGETDAIVTKLNSDLTDIIWSTYIGGTGMETGLSIKRNSNNDVLICGGSTSNNFPVTNVLSNLPGGLQDSYISHFSSDGKQLLNSIKFGTDKYDQSYFLEIDDDDDLYVLGQTEGKYPVSEEVYHNPNSGLFVHKINRELDSTIYSTVIGDLDSTNAIIANISPTAFLINECENIFIAGWGGTTNYLSSNTFNMPLVPTSTQKNTNGSEFYMMVLLAEADSLLYSTYFGGLQSREHVDGGTSRFDEKGIVYQSVCAGCGGNDDFPVFPELNSDPNKYPKLNNSANCNNGVFKYDLANIDANFDIVTRCNSLDVTFENKSIGGVTFKWDFGDGTDSTLNQPLDIVHSYPESGKYNITLEVVDLTTCVRRSFFSQTIIVHDSIPSKIYYDTLCIGTSKEIGVIVEPRDESFKWSSMFQLSDSLSPSTVVTANNSFDYIITITDTIGCKRTDTFKLVALPILDANINIDTTCNSLDIIYSHNGELGQQFFWNFGNGDDTTQSTNSLHQYYYPLPGKYAVSLTIIDSNTCNKISQDSITISIIDLIDPKVYYDTLCKNDSKELLIITDKRDAKYQWFPKDDLSDPFIVNPIITASTTTSYKIQITDSIGCLRTDTFSIFVPETDVQFDINLFQSCISNLPTKVNFINQSVSNSNSVFYTWDFGNGEIISQTDVRNYVFQKPDTFNIVLSSLTNGCENAKTKVLVLSDVTIPNIFTPNNDGVNDTFIIKRLEDGDWEFELYNRWGKLLYSDPQYENDFKAQNIEDGTYYYLITSPDGNRCKGWLQIVR